MNHEERLDFIAAGLPLILRSARGFWQASEVLHENPREALVLVGFAEEESAKALILMDLVRCPASEVSNRIGRIVNKVFYNHLARMIYAKAQAWKPNNVAELRAYIDQQRQSHYLEGDMSEYIVPNWPLYKRESTLYADIEVYEEGVPEWNDPNRWNILSTQMRPLAFGVVEALEALGVFTRDGLRASSDVWGSIDFVDERGHCDAIALAKQLFARLNSQRLVTELATDEHTRLFYKSWQIPMYNLEFDLIDVTLEQLEAQRDAAYWNEIGGY